MNLRLDWASHEAAKYACENWHYSKCLPRGKMVRVGVWENSQFIGVVLYGMGASPYLMNPYGLTMTQGCELVRVALTTHTTSVTKIVAISLKLLKRKCPNLKLVVSFADPNNGHYGGIYQGGNWVYVGESSETIRYKDKDGRILHQRRVSKTGFVKGFDNKIERCTKTEDCTKIYQTGKFRYLMPLDDDTRLKIQSLSKPYPKRPKEHESDTLGIRGRCDSDPDAPNLQDEVAE